MVCPPSSRLAAVDIVHTSLPQKTTRASGNRKRIVDRHGAADAGIAREHQELVVGGEILLPAPKGVRVDRRLECFQYCGAL
jgi:hypothetical protein